MIIPIVYLGTLYWGILGASLGTLIVGFVSVIIAYYMFVKPMTGHGFIYYLWKPLFIVLFVCLALWLLNWLTLGFLSKIFVLLFSLILIITLFFPSIKILYRQLYANIIN